MKIKKKINKVIDNLNVDKYLLHILKKYNKPITYEEGEKYLKKLQIILK